MSFWIKSKITNSEYVLRSALLSDISEERSKLSETNQIPDIYCCNVSRTVQQTCDNFQHMSDTLEDPLLGVDAFDKCLKMPHGKLQTTTKIL